MSVDISRMDTKNQNGFTLIEMLIALAVAAILLGIGIPSFSGAIKNSQISADYSQFTQALYLARSQSVKSNSPVTVCPKSAPDSKQCGNATEDWKHGIIVFMDFEPFHDVASATVGVEDEIVGLHGETRSKNTFVAIGSIDRTANTATERSFITYRQRGQANWANGSFIMCNADDVELSRVLNIAPTGDVRPGRPSGSDYPRDIFNREACVSSS